MGEAPGQPRPAPTPAVQAFPRRTPLLIYDGECGFCRAWIRRWKAITGDNVLYAPYQDVAEQFPQISRKSFNEAVQLIDTDGRVTSGAAAALQARSYGRRGGLGWWAYRHIPGFAFIAEFIYRFIAWRRGGFSRITHFFWGKNTEPPNYVLTRRLFLRLLGVVYLIAFVSFGVQVRGLVGEKGILPIGERLPALQAAYEQQGKAAEVYWRFPTLAWFEHGDWFLQWVLCGGGALLSIMLILGLFPLPVLILLWAFYLSVYVAGQVFMSFQWDILLLETGFLAIFFAPLTLWLSSPKALPPSRIVLFLLRWLLFRLMFLSGYVKLASGDPCWPDLTALTYHYETQPLPPWTAWYVHHLPLWFHQASAAIMFFIELVVPFLIFGPRRLRTFAFVSIVALMAAVGVTGNYNFFNLLTAVLCVTLLDDQFLGRFVRRKKRALLAEPPAHRPIRLAIRSTIVAPVGLALLALSIVYLSYAFRREWKLPDWAQPAFEKVEPFRLVNNYGLFRIMTKERPEIVIEGSEDGREWKEYEFRWKPGGLTRVPAFVQPHQPRLDWQMWFAALSPNRYTNLVAKLMQRILEGSEPVLSFFSHDPFPDAPPQYLRAVRYQYRFTDRQTKAETGAWWSREPAGTYLRMIRPEPPTPSSVPATPTGAAKNQIELSGE